MLRVNSGGSGGGGERQTSAGVVGELELSLGGRVELGHVRRGREAPREETAGEAMEQ